MALQINKVTFLLLLFCAINTCLSKKYKEDEKPAWAKKDIRDYSDADLERLLDQWEEDEEPLPEDEKPDYLRKPPPIDMSNVDTSNPEALLQASKKYQTLMMFVTVANNPTRSRTEQLAKIWETSLWSNHIQTERYIVADDRLLLLFKEGSQAWPAKEFLLEMEEVKEIQLEGQTFHGKKPDLKNIAVRDEL